MSASSPSTLTSSLYPSPVTTRPQAASYLQPSTLSGSNTSLPSRPTGGAPTRDPLLRTRTQLGQPILDRSSLYSQPRPSQQRHKSEADRTDALWAEMQATLAEVELSATRGTHFFGPAHAAALEELRGAQIALAQAWARGEGGDEIIDEDVEGGENGAKGRRSEDSSQKSPTASVGEGGGGEKRQEEAERDLGVARRRKEANDRYFERVGRGVVDVVGRLEEVATAMGKVKRESREVWSESDMDTGSITSGSMR